MGGLLKSLRPDEPKPTMYTAHVPPVSIRGTSIRLSDLQKTSYKRPTFFFITLNTDIWFPQVYGFLDSPMRERKTHHWHDNLELAQHHTPRFNRFLQGVRKLVLDYGGTWEVLTEQPETSFYKHMITEEGILLDIEHNSAEFSFQELDAASVQPFQNASDTLSGEAQVAVKYYAELIIEAEENIQEGKATDNLSLQLKGYAQAVIAYAGGITFSLPTMEDYFLSTAAILKQLLFEQNGNITPQGRQILHSPIFITALSTLGYVSDNTLIRNVASNHSLSLQERILRSTNTVLGLGTKALDPIKHFHRSRTTNYALSTGALAMGQPRDI
jgi:hypothetical protein